MMGEPFKPESSDTDRPDHATAGFTLVELMVSLFIFGMLAASGVALLRFSVGAQAQATQRLDRIGAIGKLNAILTADLAQAALRPVRDEVGNTLPIFLGGNGEENNLALAFVRRGWSNPDGQDRASLQRVEYRFVEGRVERTAYPMLDGAHAMDASVVIDHVKSFHLRYRRQGDWIDRWDGQESKEIPKAVELVVDTGERGPIRQLFLAGAGG